jgi:hypothetical protein
VRLLLLLLLAPRARRRLRVREMPARRGPELPMARRRRFNRG